MERTEPSLVPEWLKGVGSGSSTHHQDDGHRQRLSQHNEQESPRYSAYVPPRRITIPERHQFDKDSYTGSRVYPNFSRTPSSYRGDHQRGDWDSDRERDRERAANSFLSDGKDRDDRANGRWPGPGRVLDQEFPPRRPHSVGNSGRLAENGEKKFVNDSSTSSSIKLAGPVPKAAFERHFPSLGTQEKVYSSLGNVSVLSPRHLWQHSRTGVGLDGTLSSESRSSLLEPNGVSPSAPSGTPKMAEAPAHNPPRVRTPPQLSTETHRLELALKQSRQLVPMIPKTALNSRDKAKPKLTSLVSPSTPKIAQTPSSPMLSRQPPPIRVETPKTPQSKLHVLKPGVAIPESAPAASSGARTPSAAANATVPRKPKQLLDRRAVPIPPLSASAGGAEASRARSSSKENGVTEDKRLQVQAQNRSDFYNAIRRKAAGGGGSSSKPEEKSGSGSSGGGDGGARREDDEGQDGGESPPVAEADHRRHHPAPAAYLDNDDNNNNVANGVKSEHSIKDVVGGSEEEEAAFLRSLGWEEDGDAEGGEGLTEEEISAFYREHMRSMSSSPLSSRIHNRLQNAVLRSSGGINGLSAGISSSDSESDGEVRAANTVLASRLVG